MTGIPAYDTDLAYIHDEGYGDFARGSAPGLLCELRHSGVDTGLVVDLGCGSGVWARELVNAGYQVLGIDLSPSMIAIARQRVPEAEFQVDSFLRAGIPPCRAVTALGEVLSYGFDAENSLSALPALSRRIFERLSPGGLFIFDVAGPDRCREQKQAFTEGRDWTCLVEYQHDDSRQQLHRRIITFRKIEDVYRRHEEAHSQHLYQADQLAAILNQTGFAAQTVRSYGDYLLHAGDVGFVARKPL